MASIVDQHAGGKRAVGNRWLARVWDPILRKHVNRSFPELSQAKYWAADCETKALQGCTPGVRGDLEVWAKQFLEDGVYLTASYRRQVEIVVASAVEAGLGDPDWFQGIMTGTVKLDQLMEAMQPDIYDLVRYAAKRLPNRSESCKRMHPYERPRFK